MRTSDSGRAAGTARSSRSHVRGGAARAPARTGAAAAAAAARRRALRRRRLVGAVALLALVFVAVVSIRPVFQKAISELSLPLQYPSIIREQATTQHLDPALIAAVIYAETRFDARSSPAGAEGLMQIEPATAEFLAHRSGGAAFIASDLWHPGTNIAYGSYYLRYLLDEYDGTVWLALAAYNAGETNVDSWLARARMSGRPLSIASIPFPATRAYVQKVLSAQQDYRMTYARQLGYG